jgi:hypothetical protein
MVPFKVTLAPVKTDTIKYDGRDAPCEIYNVSPLAEQYWVNKETGVILKVVDENKHLVILKDNPALNLTKGQL